MNADYTLLHPDKFTLIQHNPKRTVDNYQVKCHACQRIFWTSRKVNGCYCNITNSVEYTEYKQASRVRAVAVPSSMIFHIIRDAYRRGIEFQVSPWYINELLQAQQFKCQLSGVSLRVDNGKHSLRGTTTASLDRIDSNAGYIAGNLQWVHKNLNRAKQDMPDTEFIEMCKQVTKFQEEKENAKHTSRNKASN